MVEHIKAILTHGKLSTHLLFCLCRYGKIVSTKAILDKNTNQCKGRSFVHIPKLNTPNVKAKIRTYRIYYCVIVCTYAPDLSGSLLIVSRADVVHTDVLERTRVQEQLTSEQTKPVWDQI